VRDSLGFNLTFSNLNLQDSFVASIEAAGYVSPTKLQSQLIPLIGDRKSAVVWSQSAAGKTGAFLIPAVNYILANPLEEKRGARILILTSRRDRVSQINYTLKRLTRDHNMRFGFIVSGRPYQPQMRLMRRPLDMMVATPGRLNDLVDNNKADFSQLEMLIIDDMTTIFQKNMHDLIGKILAQVNQECPTIAFVRQDPAVNGLVKKLFPDAIEISLTDTPTLIVSDQQLISLPKGSDKNTLHFDLPYKLDNYRNRLDIHEIGRESAMLILADGNDYDALRRIEKEIGSPIEQKTAPGLEPLNPFISTQATRPKKTNTRKQSNSNTAKKTSNQSRSNQARTNKGRTARTSSKKPAGGTTAGKTKITHARKKTTSKSPSTDEKDTRRQRKGPYGRLNGGAQRKRNDFGVSSVGTKNNQPAQMANSEWDKAIADNKPSKEPRVVIRYKDKKRTLLKDDSKPDA